MKTEGPGAISPKWPREREWLVSHPDTAVAPTKMLELSSFLQRQLLWALSALGRERPLGSLHLLSTSLHFLLPDLQRSYLVGLSFQLTVHSLQANAPAFSAISETRQMGPFLIAISGTRQMILNQEWHTRLLRPPS